MSDLSVTPGDVPATAGFRRDPRPNASATSVARASCNGRREILKRGSVLAALAACGLLTGRRGFAAAEELTLKGASSMQEALKAIGSRPTLESQIVLKVPDIAENGAFVPVSVDCRLPHPQEILIVVEANPVPVAARFTIPEGTDPFVSIRVKLAQSSNVYAVVQADGKFYSVVKAAKVTVGGCD